MFDYTISYYSLEYFYYDNIFEVYIESETLDRYR